MVSVLQGSFKADLRETKKGVCFISYSVWVVIRALNSLLLITWYFSLTNNRGARFLLDNPVTLIKETSW